MPPTLPTCLGMTDVLTPVRVGTWEADLELNAPDTVRVARDTGDDGCALVTAHGELDMLTSPRLAAAIDEALAEAPNLLVVDLTGTTFCGVAAVSALVDARTKAAESTSVHVVGSRCVARVLALVTPEEAPPCYPTLQEALAGV